MNVFYVYLEALILKHSIDLDELRRKADVMEGKS